MKYLNASSVTILTIAVLLVQGVQSIAADNPLRSDTVGKNLLYYVENENSGDYFIPIIEKVLREMAYTDSEIQLYDTIRSLNVLNENRSFESSLFTYFTYYDGRERNIADSKERYERSKELANFLLNGYDRFLRIKINPLPNNKDMEFQFWMFDVTESNWNSGSVDFKVPDLVGYFSSSALLNLEADDHEQRLIYALKKVNPEANATPQVTLFHDHKTIKNGQELFVHIGDTVKIYTGVIDRDSEQKTIQYHWYSDVPENIKNFKEETSQQEIILTNTNDTNLSLVVTDGIGQSEPFHVRLKPINLPQLYLIKQDVKGSNRLMGNFRDQTIPTINISYRRYKGVPTILHNEPVHMSMSMFDQEQEVFLQNHLEAVTDFQLISDNDGVTNDFSILSFHKTKDKDRFGYGNNYSFKLEQRFSDGEPVELMVSPSLNQVPSGTYSFSVSPSYQNIQGGSQLFRVNITEVKRYYWNVSPYLILAPESYTGAYLALDASFGFHWIPRILDTQLALGVRHTGHFNLSLTTSFTPLKLGRKIDLGLNLFYKAYQLGDIHHIAALPDSREFVESDFTYDFESFEQYGYQGETGGYSYYEYFEYDNKIDSFLVEERYAMDPLDLFDQYISSLHSYDQSGFSYLGDYDKFLKPSALLNFVGFGLVMRRNNFKNSSFTDYFFRTSLLMPNAHSERFLRNSSDDIDKIDVELNSLYTEIFEYYDTHDETSEEVEALWYDVDHLESTLSFIGIGERWLSTFLKGMQFEFGASFNFHFKKQ